jgi:uncharacterized RDD family membrane protein YckC
MNDHPDDTLPPPGLLRRLAAMLYDTLLVLPLIMLAVAIALGLYVALVKLTGGVADPDALSPALRQVIILVTVIGFFSVFWLKSGQTLGMQAWRIRLETVDGSPLTMKHCLARSVAAMLSAACVGLGYLWCLFDRDKRYWHDILSGTRLVLLPKRQKDKSKKS